MNVHSFSLKGKRDQNEDRHDVILNSNNKDKSIKNVNFFGVYDGHGGKDVSTYIKNNLSKFFVNKKVEYPLSKTYVNNVYDNIQKSLEKYSFAYKSGSTCTTVVQFKDNAGCDYLNVMNTGDSRCMLCRDNFGIPLTKDHKPHWPEEKSRISQLGGKVVYDGFDWRVKDLSVSRAFGDLDARPFLTHSPDIYRYKLDKNDKFIVLACDGLWDVMQNCDVANFVLSNCYDSSTKKRINKNVNAAKMLAEYAIKKGSTDNVSVIVAFLFNH
jgi:serine/threonine protein phosphatase PrpC